MIHKLIQKLNPCVNSIVLTNSLLVTSKEICLEVDVFETE